MQSSSSKNSKLPNNTSLIEENDNIIRYLGKNIYETNNLCDFKENTFSFWELKFWNLKALKKVLLVFFYKKCMLVIATSVEATAQVIPWRQVD